MSYLSLKTNVFISGKVRWALLSTCCLPIHQYLVFFTFLGLSSKEVFCRCQKLSGVFNFVQSHNITRILTTRQRDAHLSRVAIQLILRLSATERERLCIVLFASVVGNSKKVHTQVRRMRRQKKHKQKKGRRAAWIDFKSLPHLSCNYCDAFYSQTMKEMHAIFGLYYSYATDGRKDMRYYKLDCWHWLHKIIKFVREPWWVVFVLSSFGDARKYNWFW